MFREVFTDYYEKERLAQLVERRYKQSQVVGSGPTSFLFFVFAKITKHIMKKKGGDLDESNY